METEDYAYNEYSTTIADPALTGAILTTNHHLKWLTPADHFIKFTEPKTGKMIGRLYEEDGIIKFEGQVDESAKSFFDQIIKRQIDDIEARYKSLSCRIKWDAVK